jgi:hypothetical protein
MKKEDDGLPAKVDDVKEQDTDNFKYPSTAH